jgi:hypothetical protein
MPSGWAGKHWLQRNPWIPIYGNLLDKTDEISFANPQMLAKVSRKFKKIFYHQNFYLS